jgi:hypothetical protein
MGRIPCLVFVVPAAAAAGCASQKQATETPDAAAAGDAAGAPAAGAPPSLPGVGVADAVPGPETQPPPDAAPPPLTPPRADRPGTDPVDVRAEVTAAIDEATGTIRGSGGIPDLPAYPRSRVVSREVDTTHERWARTIEVELEVDDDFGRVRRFYDGAIRAEGWTVTGASESDDKVEWKLTSGSSVASIEIKREKRNRVSIELERNDR